MHARRSDPPLIEFKGTALRVMTAQLRSGDVGRIGEALRQMLGATPDFFSGEAAVFDCAALAPDVPVDWQGLAGELRRYGLAPVGVRGASEAQAEQARAAGLAVLNASEARPRPVAAPDPAPVVVESRPAPPAPAATLIIERPLRSGQQVYARGGDLVVLAMVNTGAEVIADGSIHIYAPLRGRALAGARGNAEARIFTTCMEAELVSIAGLYRTLENGPPAELARRPAQVRLRQDGDAQALSIEPLGTN